ncbi:Hypothetical predicted protein, partial [Paramuricea clavata]
EISFDRDGSAKGAKRYSSEKQRVDLDNNFSEDCDVKYGVPQGSCLGPILFLLYVSQLYDIIDRHLPSSHGYADDTQLYVSFRPDCQDNSESTLAILEDCISDVRTWLLSHKLMFKDSKTEFLVIGTPQQLLKINIESVNVGGVQIKPVDSVRNLGSWFDKHMSMSVHIRTLIASRKRLNLHNPNLSIINGKRKIYFLNERPFLLKKCLFAVRLQIFKNFLNASQLSKCFRGIKLPKNDKENFDVLSECHSLGMNEKRSQYIHTNIRKLPQIQFIEFTDPSLLILQLPSVVRTGSPHSEEICCPPILCCSQPIGVRDRVRSGCTSTTLLNLINSS